MNIFVGVLFLYFLSKATCFLMFDINNPHPLDEENPVADDICSPEIELPGNGVSFYNQIHRSLWLCNNGILSFTSANTRYSPEAFPIERSSIIAVFWGDVDNTGRLDGAGGINRIIRRVDTSRSTTGPINVILKQNTAVEDFDASWGFVATWFEVGHYPQETNLRNTFQVVLTCNEDSKCFCLLAYEKIEWTNSIVQWSHAQAGFNDGEGNYENLPGSRTVEMRNLPMRSNVGVDGLFIYQLTEDGVSEAQQKCGEISLSPYYANMFFEKQKFVFINALCGSSTRSGTAQVMFKGNSFNITVDGTIDGFFVNGTIPFWGKGEIIRVAVLFDGKFENKKAKNMHFVPGNQWETNNVELQAAVVASSESFWGLNVTVRLEWDESYWSTKYGPQVVVTAKIFVVQLPNDGSRGPFYFEQEVLEGKSTSIENDGSEEIDIASREGAVFVQLDVLVPAIQPCHGKNLSFGECTNDPLTTEKPVFTEIDELFCNDWLDDEEEVRGINSGEAWDVAVGKAFPCPVNANGDADMADLEVSAGLVGWQYDPCCSKTAQSSTTRDFGFQQFCRSGQKCQFNVDAAFCIQSPTLIYQERDINNNLVQISASNQCCYNYNGDLLKTGSANAGKARKSSITKNNFLEFFLSEIPPLNYCQRNQHVARYNAVRPITRGDYQSRMVIFNFGDPHLTTYDRFEYTFNGLGVYIITETMAGHPTNLTMQVSTRRIGNGTVFSGFHIKDFSASMEFYLNTINTVVVIIDGVEIDTRQFAQLDTDGVQFSRNNSSTEFSFKLLGSDFIVKALVGEGGVVNLGLAPPFELNGTFQGLMGNFDGAPENDLSTRDGNTVPISSNLSVIHKHFGESWAVSEEDWLFSTEVSVMIHDDISRGSPYTPVYTAQFQSEELRRAAEEVCSNDERCLLDVSLTGDIALASNSMEMRELIETTDFLNEAALVVFRVETNTPTPEFFSEDKRPSTLAATEAFQGENTTSTAKFSSEDTRLITLAATELFREEITTSIPEFPSEDKALSTLAATEAFHEENTTSTAEFSSEDTRLTTLAATELFREEITTSTPEFPSEDKTLSTLAATQAFREENTRSTPEFSSEDRRLTTLAATEVFHEQNTTSTPKFSSEDRRLTTLAATEVFHEQNTTSSPKFFSEDKKITTLAATEAFREENTTSTTPEFFSEDKRFTTVAAWEAFLEETSTATPEFLSEDKRFTTLAATKAFREETTTATPEISSEEKLLTTPAATEAFREETTTATPEFLSEDKKLITLAATEAFSEDTETSKDKKGLTLLSIMLISLGVMVALIVLIATVYTLYVFLKPCSGNRVGVMPERQAWDS